ncbi:MAG: radical SAM protein [Candidatus Caldatribacteriota bacterium]
MDYIVYSHNDSFIYVSKINGNQIILKKDIPQDSKIFKTASIESMMNIPINYNQVLNFDNFDTIYISLHTSNFCNMKCRYCFMQKRTECSISIDDATKFIDLIVNRFPNAHKFIVDPTGSGEPLLRLNFLIELSDYCKTKSNEISKEVLPMFVTNGTLLTSQNIKAIQDAGYIFGVSVDGYKKSHDQNRLDFTQKGTYKKIIKNIKKVKHRTFLGAAVTLSNENMNLVKAVVNLKKWFTTISIKPVRSFDDYIEGINNSNINLIRDNYTELYKFIRKTTLSGQFQYLDALLNGDDYFGKFIIRVLLNQKVVTRCDAGIGRFSLTPDKKIISCPGAIGIDLLVIGDLETGIDESKVNSLWDVLIKREDCKNCEIRFVCGGECMVNSYYKNKVINHADDIMCEFKKHLFELSVKFKYELINHSEELFYRVQKACFNKIKRFQKNEELSLVLKQTNGRYDFIELKKIYDEDYEKFKEIKDSVI